MWMYFFNIQAASASYTHNEGIIKTWLSKARVDKHLATALLDTGGFVCWAVLVQIHLQVHYCILSLV